MRSNWHDTEKVKDQIDTIEKLGTKLKYGCERPQNLSMRKSAFKKEIWVLVQGTSLFG